jgi:transcriptional regulator with XRE-family HTH domain
MISKLRIARLLNGRSQDEISGLTGIDQSKLSRVERGYGRLSLEEKRKLAAAVNCDPADLWPDLEPEQAEVADAN